jgi:hypothetical protein
MEPQWIYRLHTEADTLNTMVPGILRIPQSANLLA